MPDRYHALDALRAFAMFLGIALHAAVSFLITTFPLWPVRDRDSTPLADVFLIAVHDFRLQLFFVLAGFFGCLMYQRYGLFGLLKNRVRRVAAPLVLGVLFIVPTVMVAFLYVEIENYKQHGPPENPSDGRQFIVQLAAESPEQSTLAIIVDFMISPRVFERVPPPAHLWFLYYLLFLYVAVLMLAPALARMHGTRFLERIDAAFRRVVAGRGRVLVPTILTVPTLFTMTTWLVDTPAGWGPMWQVIGYYFLFFGFGWMLFRHRDLIDTFGRGWKWNLLVANVLVLPAMMALTIGGKQAEDNGTDVLFAWQLAAFTAQSLYTWMMIAGLWGAFLRWFGSASTWSRYLADASYWCYLASITPIVFLQFWVADWPLPGVVKFAFILIITMTLLLASYEWGVRYTFIGAILNGRKRRMRVARLSGDDHREESSWQCSVGSKELDAHGS
jgi:peptidoglycan/LPS O-acetylase OafA/YrhL